MRKSRSAQPIEKVIGTDISSHGGTLEKGLRILELLQSANAPLSLSRIAEETSSDPSSAYRVLQLLVKLEYAVRVPDTKLYSPSPKALLPLSLYHPLNAFRGDAHESLRRLRERTGLTVAAALFISAERLVIDLVSGRDRLSPIYETYLKRPIHSSATGKVLLLSVLENQWPDLLGPEPYPAFTPNTITTAAEMRRQLEVAAARGFTSTRDESLIGLSAVAAPIKAYGGQILGCIVAFGASSGILTANKVDELGAAVSQEAALLSETAPSIKDMVALLGTRAPARQIGFAGAVERAS